MEKKNTLPINKYLLYERDKSKILEMIYLLDRQLRYLHDRGFCVDNLNSDTIVFEEDGTFRYTALSKMDPKQKKEIYQQQNINELVSLSLGIYVFLETKGNYFYDYTKIAKQEPDFVSKNYSFIRSNIPYETDYYDKIINDKKVEYFSDYVDRKAANRDANNMGANKSVPSLVKATPEGRAYAGDVEAAFINKLFYPIIVLCMVIFAIMIYLLYKYL